MAFVLCSCRFTSTCLYCAAADVHNETALATKNACKSICLGVQDTADASIIMLITHVADAINFV